MLLFRSEPSVVYIYRHIYFKDIIRMNASSYAYYFGSSVEERAENMASREWNIQTRMPRRTLRGPPFRALPESIEMEYYEEDNVIAAGNANEAEEEEDDEDDEDDEEAEEGEDEDDEELGSNFYGDMVEDFTLYFDNDRHRFMEQFSEISNSRNASSTIYCISQHYELNYTNYPSLYALTLSGSIGDLKDKNDTLEVTTCTCSYFENSDGDECKHMLLFKILYADFRGLRRSRRNRSAPNRLLL